MADPQAADRPADEPIAEDGVLLWDEAPATLKLFYILDRQGSEDIDEVPRFVDIIRVFVLVGTMVLNCMIALVIMIGSLPVFDNAIQPWQGLLLFLAVVFTIDYLARFFCTRRKLYFLVYPLNLLDVVTLLPLFVSSASSGKLPRGMAYSLMALRLVHVFHGLLHAQNYDIVMATIGESSEVATLMALIMVVGLPMGGTMVFYAERGEFNEAAGKWYRPCFPPATCETEESPFQNAFDGLWWFFITTTTVGYGDLVPKTRMGQIIGAISMSLGILMIAYPIMILAVNFEEEREKEERERTLGSVDNGNRIRELQRANTVVLCDEESLSFQRPMPIYFYPKETNTPRALVLTSPSDVRYEPLFMLQRNKDNTLFILQTVKATLEINLRLVFDTAAAQRLALDTIRHFQTDGLEASRSLANTTGGKGDVKSARFFPVVRLYLKLDVPHNKCEFLQRLRLSRRVIDDIDLDVMRVDIPLELTGYGAELDEQKRLDFHQSLHRCRLHVTAAVAYDEPVYYEVPVLLGLLAATSLMRELLAKQKPVVYATQSQVESLLNGVHHLIDLDTPEPSIIINPREIREAVANAIILRATTRLDDPHSVPEDQFLYGRANPANEQFHSIFVKRLGRKGNVEDAETVLCKLKVLAVQPRHQSMSIVL